jgi:hypothetical protein
MVEYNVRNITVEFLATHNPTSKESSTTGSCPSQPPKDCASLLRLALVAALASSAGDGKKQPRKILILGMP